MSKEKISSYQKQYNTDYEEVMALMQTHGKKRLQSMLFLLYN